MVEVEEMRVSEGDAAKIRRRTVRACTHHDHLAESQGYKSSSTALVTMYLFFVELFVISSTPRS